MLRFSDTCRRSPTRSCASSDRGVRGISTRNAINQEHNRGTLTGVTTHNRKHRKANTPTNSNRHRDDRGQTRTNLIQYAFLESNQVRMAHEFTERRTNKQNAVASVMSTHRGSNARDSKLHHSDHGNPVGNRQDSRQSEKEEIGRPLVRRGQQRGHESIGDRIARRQRSNRGRASNCVEGTSEALTRVASARGQLRLPCWCESGNGGNFRMQYVVWNRDCRDTFRGPSSDPTVLITRRKPPPSVPGD